MERSVVPSPWNTPDHKPGKELKNLVPVMEEEELECSLGRERQQLTCRKRSCWCSRWTACSHSYAADLLRATPGPDTSSADTNDTYWDEMTATRGGGRVRVCLCFYSGASLSIYLFLGRSRTTNKVFDQTFPTLCLRMTVASVRGGEIGTN